MSVCLLSVESFVLFSTVWIRKSDPRSEYGSGSPTLAVIVVVQPGWAGAGGRSRAAGGGLHHPLHPRLPPQIQEPGQLGPASTPSPSYIRLQRTPVWYLHTDEEDILIAYGITYSWCCVSAGCLLISQTVPRDLFCPMVCWNTCIWVRGQYFSSQTKVPPVLWIRNDLFRIRIQLQIFRVPDPDPTNNI